MTGLPLIESIFELERGDAVWFVDIWGVMHNGVRPYPSAVFACREFRLRGGRVILVSNSPRTRDGVIRQLDQVGVSREAYDAAVTSGDVSRVLIAAHKGAAVFHLGPGRDLPVYEGLEVKLAPAKEARSVVCTGLFDDERETPDTYAPLLADFKARDLEMICVNPDLQVERGGRIIYCAGAVAAAYEALGGRVLYAGKPYAPIYEEAMRVAGGLTGRHVERARVLAIGDGVKTDIKGASLAGIASVYVASAVHVRTGETLAEAAGRLFPDPNARPVAVMERLA